MPAAPDPSSSARPWVEELARQIAPSRSRLAGVAAALLVAVVLFTGGDQVPSDSVAVLQRFGRFHASSASGLHLKIPFGVDVATIVPVKRQLKQELGFETQGATDPVQSPVPRGRHRWSLATSTRRSSSGSCSAASPIRRSTSSRSGAWERRCATVSESTMRAVVGDRTVDEVITIGRQEIEAEALIKMQALVTRYAMGVSIDQVQLKNINPPLPVKASINEVNQAQQEKEKLIIEARREYNKPRSARRG